MSASRTSTQRHVASTSSTFSASSQPKPSASSQSSASSKPNVPTTQQQRPKSATAPQSAPIITPDRLASTMGTKVDEWLRSALSTLETTSKSDVCTCDFSADAFPADEASAELLSATHELAQAMAACANAEAGVKAITTHVQEMKEEISKQVKLRMEHEEHQSKLRNQLSDLRRMLDIEMKANAERTSTSQELSRKLKETSTKSPAKFSTPKKPINPISPPCTPLTLPLRNTVKSYDEESDIFEDIPVVIHMPDGSQQNLSLKIGETIQNIKQLLEDQYNIPTNSVTLSLDGVGPMIDPLSLNDFPTIMADKKAVIRVQQTLNPEQPQEQLAQIDISDDALHSDSFSDESGYQTAPRSPTSSACGDPILRDADLGEVWEGRDAYAGLPGFNERRTESHKDSRSWFVANLRRLQKEYERDKAALLAKTQSAQQKANDLETQLAISDKNAAIQIEGLRQKHEEQITLLTKQVAALDQQLTCERERLNSEMKQKESQAQTDVTELRAQVNTLREEKTFLTNQCSAKDTLISNAQQEISKVQEELRIRRKKWKDLKAMLDSEDSAE